MELTEEHRGQLYDWADWLEALDEDGDWQGKGKLCNKNGQMCCLGVAAYIGIAYDECGDNGMTNKFCGLDMGDIAELAALNDRCGWSFAKIAVLVRRYADTGDFYGALEFAKEDRE